LVQGIKPMISSTLSMCSTPSNIPNPYQVFLFLHWLMWFVSYLLQHIHMVDYINWFSNIEPALHFWNEPYLISAFLCIASTCWFYIK
jgi:hypothetical protein